MAELITAIDLGSSKICVVIAEVDKSGQVQILGLGKSPSYGIKKGVVVDIETTAKSIMEAIEKAENMADVEISGVYINIPGGYSNIINNRGVIAVSGDDHEISPEDIERVMNSAAIISIPREQMIIDVIPNQYILDGYDEIKDPIGMAGTRLEVDADIITASITATKNLVKSVNRAGIEVLGIVVEPFALADSVLTDDELELGVLMVDIGAGKTDISLFKNKRLIYSNIIPVGGNHITNDISIGLRIPLKDSEDIKRKYGVVNLDERQSDKRIEITQIGTNNKVQINETSLLEIIGARVDEIFELIDLDLERKNLRRELLAGIVITGGGVTYLKGIQKFGNYKFRLPFRIGKPNYIGVKEPIFSSAVGIITYISKRKFRYYIEYNNIENKRNKNKPLFKSNIKFSSLLKKVWNEYF